MFHARPLLMCARAPLLLAIGCAFGLVAADRSAVGAEAPPHAGESAARIGELTAEPLKAGLYLLSSAAGNSVLRLSGNGLILVDGQRSADYADLIAVIRKIDKQPIVAVINTNHDAVHTGTNAQFLAEKVPVVGQRNELARPAAAGGNAPPSVTFEQNESMHFGAVEVRLLHFGRAHTDADTVVYFPDSKVVALGELYAPRPDPDYAAGGSLLEWRTALADALQLDFNLAIPGRGPPVSRADVESLRTKLDALVERAARSVANGTPKDRFARALEAGDSGSQLDFNAAQIDGFYDELVRAKTRAR